MGQCRKLKSRVIAVLLPNQINHIDFLRRKLLESFFGVIKIEWRIVTPAKKAPNRPPAKTFHRVV